MTSSPSSPAPEHVPGALWRKQSTKLPSPHQKNPIQKEQYAQCALLLAINPCVPEELSGNLRERGSSAVFVLTKDTEEGGN